MFCNPTVFLDCVIFLEQNTKCRTIPLNKFAILDSSHTCALSIYHYQNRVSGLKNVEKEVFSKDNVMEGEVHTFSIFQRHSQVSQGYRVVK